MAYRKKHSTETALISVTDGQLNNADQELVSLLTRLDLSAAFNTLHQRILLDRLSHTFGVGETALEWFASYLVSRTQSVVIDGMSSKLRCPPGI